MPKDAQVRARIELELKTDAESILTELGLTPSAAVNMFYSQIVHHRGLPFDVALPTEAVRVEGPGGRGGSE